MYLKNIYIKNFRNYEEQKVDFNKGINIIYGDNAQGKTNLLESIYVLGLTKSHRSIIDNSLIKDNSDYSNILGNVDIKNINTKLEVDIGKTTKKLKIDNNEVKKVSDYICKLNIIIFYPEDLELIKSSPIIRRRYFNIELSQINKSYYLLLNDYNKLLKMRNDLLKKQSKNIDVDENYFDIITNYFIDKAVEIYRVRNKFINKINEKAPKIYENISNMEGFKIKYHPNIEFNTYEKNEIKLLLSQKLEKLKDVEKKLGTTLVGPHRDDYEFYLNNNNLKTYGSQGQQRMAVLALKLSEIEIFEKYNDETPILLLDDVFSELDDNKKNNLLSYITNNIQTIITTTDLNNLDKKIIENAKLIKVNQGNIEEGGEDGRE